VTTCLIWYSWVVIAETSSIQSELRSWTAWLPPVILITCQSLAETLCRPVSGPYSCTLCLIYQSLSCTACTMGIKHGRQQQRH
jgi:hypothetical protein